MLAAEEAALLGGVGGELEPRKLLPRRWGGAGLPLLDPGLVPPGVRRVRIACAPKLIRRVKGVVGAVREVVSSSSIAFSSIESELLVEMLPLRRVKGAAVAGDDPERPRVEMESRRRWSFIAAVVTAPGKTVVPAVVELLLWKRFVKAADVTEPRRLRDTSAGGLLLELSLDIVAIFVGGPSGKSQYFMRG